MIYVLILVILNGLFSMSEIAVVSARQARLQAQADAGDTRARSALALAESPDSFLSTVQIGITLVGILAGAVGAETIAHTLAPYLQDVPVIGAYSLSVSLVIVVTSITFLQLVVGELTPKQIALNDAERIAKLVAAPMQVLSNIAAPLVWLLNQSTRGMLWLLRIKPTEQPVVTREEVEVLMELGAEAGVFEPIKGEMVEQVFRLGDRRVNEIMTPRPEVVLLDLEEPFEDMRKRIIETGHSRFPVVRGDEDNIVGILLARDLLSQSLAGEIDLKSIIRPALILPEGMALFDVLERFKKDKSQIAILIDEFGELQGLVTFIDLLEEIVGDVPEFGDPEDPEAKLRQDGSWLVDGRYSISNLKSLLDIKRLPEEEENYYTTVGGFIMNYLGRLPDEGDHFEWDRYQFEVIDMDWRRVDKVLVTPIPPAEKGENRQTDEG